MYVVTQSLMEPMGQTHPQQQGYTNAPYANGFKRQQAFSSLSSSSSSSSSSSPQTPNQPVFRCHEEFPQYYSHVTTDFNSSSAAARLSSSIFGQAHDVQETVRRENKKYSTAIGPRKAAEMITSGYDFVNFEPQRLVDASAKFYPREDDVTGQDPVTGSHVEFHATREIGHPSYKYRAAPGNEVLKANLWLGEEREESPPCQTSPVISVSPVAQEEDWYMGTRRHSTSSTGSDDFSPFLEAGDGEDKDRYSQNRMLPPCRICGARASGFHYGVNSCEACKGFFRRALKRPITFQCTKDNTCDIKGNRRSTCRFCRYKRCLRLGMSRDAIKTGRYSHRKRTSDIIEVKQLENTPGFPVDEMDFDNVLDTLMTAHNAQESLAPSKETEAEIYARQSKELILHGLRQMKREDTEDTESALPASKTFSKTDKNDIYRSPLTKNTLIANSDFSQYVQNATTTITTTTTNNNSNSSNKREDGGLLLNGINNCSNSNSNSNPNPNDGYPQSGTASPSLSSTSNDSGFHEDGLSAADVSEKGKMVSGWREPLDLSVKRKREENKEEEQSKARQNVAHLIPDDSESCFISSARADFQSDLAEVTWLRESGFASRAEVACDRLAEQVVPCLSMHDSSTASSRKDFLQDSDSTCITGYAHKRRKLERGKDLPGNSFDHKLPDYFLAKSRFLGKEDGYGSAEIEELWEKDVIDVRENRRGWKSSDSSEGSSCLTSDMDQSSGNDDVEDRSTLGRSTVKGDHDDIRLVDKELPKSTSHEAAKKWVTGYINFANTIPGFTDLPAKTKGSLLRQSWDEVWMLQAYSGYNRGLGVVTMPSGKSFLQEQLDHMWGRDNSQVAFDVAHVIKKCRLTQEMLVLLKAVCIVSPDRCPCEGRDKVEQIHWCLVTCLFKVIEGMNSDPDVMTFPKLVTVLTSLRNLSESGQWNRQDGCLDQSFGLALFPDCLPS